ncbi:MAG: hypothetical protein V1859_11290 [archaeon]
MAKAPKKNIGLWFIQNLKFIILALILMIIFNDYVVRIILFIILGLIGIESIKITRFLPNINLETIGATSIFLAYRYDWKIAALFSVVFGLVGFMKVSKLNLMSLMVIALNCLGGTLAQFLKIFGYKFELVFIMAMIIKNVISIPVMQVVNPNIPKNIGHAIIDGFINVFLIIHFMSIINLVLDALHLY